jgi:hypothetical protein
MLSRVILQDMRGTYFSDVGVARLIPDARISDTEVNLRDVDILIRVLLSILIHRILTLDENYRPGMK